MLVVGCVRQWIDQRESMQLSVDEHETLVSERHYACGKMRAIERDHHVLAAPASGRFNDQLKSEFTSTIERLLADRAPGVATTQQPSGEGSVTN